MHYKIVFSYDGSDYYGYAKQPNKNTIQGNIENCLKILFNEDITIHSSGRTDKGVHALAQVADFNTNKEIKPNNIAVFLNKTLPNSIKILNCEIVDDTFSSRFSAKKKTYVYLISTVELDIFIGKYVYINNKLDIEKMKEAASYFIGKHNYQNFTSKPDDYDDFERTIYSIKFKKIKNIYEISFTGNGFMKYMIRKIVGTLIEIGLGKIDYTFIENNLDVHDRKIVNYTAPSNALFLKKVFY